MSYFVSDSQVALPRIVSRGGAAGSITAAPSAVDSPAPSAATYAGHIDSPSPTSISYSSEVGPFYEAGGNIISPPNPQTFGSGEQPRPGGVPTPPA